MLVLNLVADAVQEYDSRRLGSSGRTHDCSGGVWEWRLVLFPVLVMRRAVLFVKLTGNIPSMGLLFLIRRQGKNRGARYVDRHRISQEAFF